MGGSDGDAIKAPPASAGTYLEDLSKLLGMASIEVAGTAFVVGLCTWKLSKKFPSVAFKGTARPSVVQHSKKLRGYVSTFGIRQKRFVTLTGPMASGKTSIVHQAFGGWRGVTRIMVRVSDWESAKKLRLPAVVGGEFFLPSILPEVSSRRLLKRIDVWSRLWFRHPHVLVINIQASEVTSKQINSLGAKVAMFAREISFDRGLVPIVIETSLPSLASAIVLAAGGTSKPMYVLPMALEEFKMAAADYFITNGKDALLKLGISAPAVDGWVQRLRRRCSTAADEAARTAVDDWLRKTILKHEVDEVDEEGKKKSVETIMEDYFFKVGPNVRLLAALIEDGDDGDTFDESIKGEHRELAKRLLPFETEKIQGDNLTEAEELHSIDVEGLTPSEVLQVKFAKNLLLEMVEAGPHGLLTSSIAKEKILGLRTDATIARRIHEDTITLHYVGHVYALLMQKYNNDKKVRDLMKDYGWVDMTRPKKDDSKAASA